MEIGQETSQKKSMGNKPVTRKKPSIQLATLPSGKIKPVKFKEPHGNLGDLIVKSRVMSTELNADGVFRELIYIKGAQSIYIDKLGDIRGLTISPILLERGEILASDPLLIRFLKASEQNVKNGGTAFKEENSEVDAQVKLDAKAAFAEAFIMANKTMSIEKVRAVLRTIGTQNVSLMSDSVARLAAVDYAEKAPENFLATVASPLPDVIASVSVAFETNVIELGADKHSVGWKDSQSYFLKIPPGFESDRVEYISKYLLTEDGAEILDAINKKINKK